MASTRHGPIVPIAPAPAHRVKALFAASLALALAAAVALRAYVSPDALAPVVASLLFACAALTVGAALLIDMTRRANWIDVAGVLTMVGIGITILIEPEQMVGLITPADRPD